MEHDDREIDHRARYRRNAPCPKCGDKRISVTWMPAKQVILMWIDEHIECECLHCSYIWYAETNEHIEICDKWNLEEAMKICDEYGPGEALKPIQE